MKGCESRKGNKSHSPPCPIFRFSVQSSVASIIFLLFCLYAFSPVAVNISGPGNLSNRFNRISLFNLHLVMSKLFKVEMAEDHREGSSSESTVLLIKDRTISRSYAFDARLIARSLSFHSGPPRQEPRVRDHVIFDPAGHFTAPFMHLSMERLVNSPPLS